MKKLLLLSVLLVWSLLLAADVFMVGNKYYDLEFDSSDSTYTYISTDSTVFYLDQTFYFNKRNNATWPSYDGNVQLFVTTTTDTVDSFYVTVWSVNLDGKIPNDSTNFDLSTLLSGVNFMFAVSDSPAFHPVMPGIKVRSKRYFSEAAEDDSTFNISIGVFCR